MAKKPAKKPVKKASAPKKPATKKPVPKQAIKPSAPKASGAKGGGPFPVTTGTGATPLQAGKTFVKMFNEGRAKDIESFYWTPDVVSVEGCGVSMEWRGQPAVRQKGEEWEKDHIIHGAKAEGPYVGATGFAVKFTIDVETKSTGARAQMVEIGVYTIRDGKICREEFMYYQA